MFFLRSCFDSVQVEVKVHEDEEDIDEKQLFQPFFPPRLTSHEQFSHIVIKKRYIFCQNVAFQNKHPLASQKIFSIQTK
jgi:hypothetical protein